MLLKFNWLTRWLGFAWVGVLTLGLHPERGAALEVQVAGYAVAALAMLGWFLVDHDQRVARHRDRALPMLLGLIASASGCAAAAGGAGTFLLVFGFVATMVAGSEASRTAASAVTAAGILASEIGALAFGGGYSVIVGFPLAMASGLLTGRNRAAYRLQARQSTMLLAQREQLAAEHRRADLLDERARIAREIHDVLAHSLGALSIQVQAARSVLTDRGDIPAASELLAAAQRMTAEGLVEARRAISALRADTLPLEEELRQRHGDLRGSLPGSRLDGHHRDAAASAARRDGRPAARRPGGPRQRGQARARTAGNGSTWRSGPPTFASPCATTSPSPPTERTRPPLLPQLSLATS